MFKWLKRLFKSSLRFEVFVAKDGWRFRVVSANNKIVASGEAYRNKSDCIKTVNLIKKEARKAKVVELL